MVEHMAFSLLVPNLLNTCRKRKEKKNIFYFLNGCDCNFKPIIYKRIRNLYQQVSINVKPTTGQLVSTVNLEPLTVSKNRILKTINLYI